MPNYDAIKNHASNLGDEYLKAITDLGEHGVAKMIRRVHTFLSIEDLDDREWAKAIGQYMLASAGKSLTTREEDKYIRLFFDQHVRRDTLETQMSLLLSGRSISQQVSESTDKMESLVTQAAEMRAELQKKEHTLRGALAGLPDEQRKKLTTMLASQNDAVEQLLEEFQNALDEASAIVANTSPATEQISKRIQPIRDALNMLTKDIASVEKELGLTMQPETEDARQRLDSTFDKVMRYIEAHKGLFTWHCSECGWSGLFCKRVPPEGALADSLAHRWLWVCPGCKSVMAAGVKHPFFHKDLVFSMEAWNIACEEGLSLINMAKILNTRPKAIIWVVTKILDMPVPEHIKKEFEKYESDFGQDSSDENNDDQDKV